MAVLFQTRSDSELACSRKTPSSATASIAAGRRRPVTEPHPGVHRRDGPGQPSCFTYPARVRTAAPRIYALCPDRACSAQIEMTGIER
eukprot:COSAG02_NODE_1193_length_13958_cov_4.939029_13_plen_88_part_00